MIVIDKSTVALNQKTSRNVKLIIFTLTCRQVKNIKILTTRFFWIGDQLIGWVNLIISNDQIMNLQPVPNIFFDLIGISISDKEILVYYYYVKVMKPCLK